MDTLRVFFTNLSHAFSRMLLCGWALFISLALKRFVVQILITKQKKSQGHDLATLWIKLNCTIQFVHSTNFALRKTRFFVFKRLCTNQDM